MGETLEFQIDPVLQPHKKSAEILHWTPQKKVGSKIPSQKRLPLDAKPPPPLHRMLLNERCRNFKSLLFCKQWIL
jgi:hypothetical protein